jgi:hypothetical protein
MQGKHLRALSPRRTFHWRATCLKAMQLVASARLIAAPKRITEHTNDGSYVQNWSDTCEN